mmetsp:Transcript_19998/g.46698  ORF Transcript_19998/g.46698 Transcript_19998/m.46698 type:complete len:396 (-) Transcript_19998:5598-6785(-)
MQSRTWLAVNVQSCRKFCSVSPDASKLCTAMELRRVRSFRQNSASATPCAASRLCSSSSAICFTMRSSATFACLCAPSSRASSVVLGLCASSLSRHIAIWRSPSLRPGLSSPGPWRHRSGVADSPLGRRARPRNSPNASLTASTTPSSTIQWVMGARHTRCSISTPSTTSTGKVAHSVARPSNAGTTRRRSAVLVVLCDWQRVSAIPRAHSRSSTDNQGWRCSTCTIRGDSDGRTRVSAARSTPVREGSDTDVLCTSAAESNTVSSCRASSVDTGTPRRARRGGITATRTSAANSLSAQSGSKRTAAPKSPLATWSTSRGTHSDAPAARDGGTTRGTTGGTNCRTALHQSPSWIKTVNSTKARATAVCCSDRLPNFCAMCPQTTGVNSNKAAFAA